MDNYQAIINQNARKIFNEYVAALNVPNIDYFAIGVQDSIHKTSASLMSRVEWQQTFKTNQFAAHDPIRIAALNTKRRVFTFDEVDYLDNLGNEIMNQRKKFEIRHGLVLLERNRSHNFMLTLATDYRQFNAKDFFLRHQDDIDKIFKDFIQIITPYTKNYIKD